MIYTLESVFKKLMAFAEHEQTNAKKPLPEGPFAKLLKTISIIQIFQTSK